MLHALGSSGAQSDAPQRPSPSVSVETFEQPVCASHVSAVQGSPSSQITGVWLQMPAPSQTSWLQAFPSEHSALTVQNELVQLETIREYVPVLTTVPPK